MENTYRRITYHRMARLNAYVSAAKYFILEARRGRKEKTKAQVCALSTHSDKAEKENMTAGCWRIHS